VDNCINIQMPFFWSESHARRSEYGKVSGLQTNRNKGHRSVEKLMSLFEVSDIFTGRFTQYFVVSFRVFKRKCIEFVLSVLFSQSGTNKHLRLKKEIKTVCGSEVSLQLPL